MVAGMSDAPEPGHVWSTPSIEHLRQLMRHVFTHQEEANEKGRRAREDIVKYYSQESVASLVIQQLHKEVDEVFKEKFGSVARKPEESVTGTEKQEQEPSAFGFSGPTREVEQAFVEDKDAQDFQEVLSKIATESEGKKRADILLEAFKKRKDEMEMEREDRRVEDDPLEETDWTPYLYGEEAEQVEEETKKEVELGLSLNQELNNKSEQQTPNPSELLGRLNLEEGEHQQQTENEQAKVESDNYSEENNTKVKTRELQKEETIAPRPETSQVDEGGTTGAGGPWRPANLKEETEEAATLPPSPPLSTSLSVTSSPVSLPPSSSALPSQSPPLVKQPLRAHQPIRDDRIRPKPVIGGQAPPIPREERGKLKMKLVST
jgi:hypothetical protein